MSSCSESVLAGSSSCEMSQGQRDQSDEVEYEATDQCEYEYSDEGSDIDELGYVDSGREAEPGDEGGPSEEAESENGDEEAEAAKVGDLTLAIEAPVG